MLPFSFPPLSLCAQEVSGMKVSLITKPLPETLSITCPVESHLRPLPLLKLGALHS